MAGRIVQSFSLTKSEHRRLKALSKAKDQTMTDQIRLMIHKEVFALSGDELDKFRTEMARLRADA